MIEKLFVKNYGCLRDVETPKLGALHAFIGPNDSGKSTLLRAVRVLSHCASPFANLVSGGGLIENDFELKHGDPVWLGAETSRGAYGIEFREGHCFEGGHAKRTEGMKLARRLWGQPLAADTHLAAREDLTFALLCRFEPDALRKRSKLIPDGGVVTFADDKGHGLAGVYDAIINRGDDSFSRIRTELVRLFPTVRTVRLRNITDSEKALEVQLANGTQVRAEHVSEGLLYYLAFAALPYVSPITAVLVEEPENGLHPARIADIMRVLREFSTTGTQVLIATHSPLVVNELSGEEVSVVTRDEKGTKVTLMKDTPNFDERSKVYALGELWVSYANGKDEAPLMTSSPKA